MYICTQVNRKEDDFESICAFLNRRGGHVVLGAKDNGEIVGVNPAKVQEQMGNSHAIATALPTYRIDLLCRVNDTELYDDRELLSCNLLKAYPIMMDFIKKHLPEQPYIEGIQRFSLRDKILREVALNHFLCKCLHKTAYVKFHIMSSSATNNKKCYCESKRCA